METVACLYIPSFPAVAARALLPGHSSIIVTWGKKVVALTSNLEHSGVQPGDNINRAKELCPTAFFVERNRVSEHLLWQDILLFLYAYTGKIESPKQGLAYFIPQATKPIPNIFKGIEVQSGIGKSRSFARLAAIKAYTGSIINAQSDPQFLQNYPSKLLKECDFERDMVDKLHLFGLNSLGAIARLTKRHCTAQFGKEGTRLYAMLHPIENEASIGEFTPSPVIRTEYDFDDPVREPGDILPVLKHLISTTAPGLMQYECTIITVYGESQKGEQVSASRILRESTRKPSRIYAVGELLTNQLLKEEREYSSLILELSGLIKYEPVQIEMFADKPKLKLAIEQILRKYPDGLKKAVLFDPEAYRAEDGYKFEVYSV